MNNDSKRTSVNEMEQIQRGLEEFLEKEMRQAKAEGQSTAKEREPQLFTIEEEETKEKEINVIGMNSHRILGEDYVEDWDSRERRSVKGQNTRSANAKRKDTGSNSIKGNNAKRSNAGKRNVKAQSVTHENTKCGGGTEDRKRGGRKKKKKSRLKKFLLIFVILLALLGSGLYWLVGVMYDKMNYAQIDSLVKAPMKEDGVVNILLIGNDSRENGADGRSDAMILLSISNKTKKIYMTSLLRDMYVEIPGHDGNRLNAAYSYGGAELLMETIEKQLDITVNS